MRFTSTLRYVFRVLATGAVLASFSGCTQPVHLEAAEFAPDPVCARVLQKFPRTLAGLPRLSTDAQATLAYGDPQAPITVRCGIAPPPPTTDRCISVSNENSAAPIDWINPEAGSELLPPTAPSDAWVFLSYGRTPAIEVVIPPQAGIDQPTAVLLALEQGVQIIEPTAACIGAFDVGDQPGDLPGD
ncbi:MAG: DUF3515 family protein [Bowdeniella nasicola]|nr:DUF3515 family protein [Bowdeniella nasicola]